MKLRNKKTGEIIRFYDGITLNGEDYDSLAELNDEWEDVKSDPYIVDMLEDNYISSVAFGADLQEEERAKECGLYFETKEEAEKAVEKLKAWKRLKDKGFRFEGWNWKTQGIDYSLDYTEITEEQSDETDKDIDLLFGGE